MKESFQVISRRQAELAEATKVCAVELLLYNPFSRHQDPIRHGGLSSLGIKHQASSGMGLLIICHSVLGHAPICEHDNGRAAYLEDTPTLCASMLH